MTIGIVQISDLHFGMELQPPIFRTTPVASARWRALSVTGQYPHDPGALVDLARALKRIRSRTRGWNKAVLVVSGDLTVGGDDSEFSNALTVLHGRAWLDAVTAIGLHAGFDDVCMVPGNHDHWAGYLLTAWAYARGYPAGRPVIHDRYFRGDPQQPDTPWWLRTYSTDDLSLQLMGVDSNAGAGSTFLARGCLPTGWDAALEQSMHAAAVGGDVVRALVVHHGLAGGSSGFVTWSHGHEPASETALRGFLRRNRVHMMLTGHMHEPHVGDGAPDGKGDHDVELRCGTTLQGAPLGKLSSPVGQTLLVHEIRRAAAGLELETETWYRTPHTQAFVRGSRPALRPL